MHSCCPLELSIICSQDATSFIYSLSLTLNQMLAVSGMRRGVALVRLTLPVQPPDLETVHSMPGRCGLKACAMGSPASETPSPLKDSLHA